VLLPSAIKHLSTPPIVKAAEGEVRAGPYKLPVTGGWLSAEAGASTNWWQLGYNVEFGPSRSAIVEACVSAYSQTTAMCPGDHWLATDKGGRKRVTTSSLSRVLREPNDYQSMSDFLLNSTRHLYLDGNAYALCLRNDRYEIDELHLMDPRMCWPQIATDGSIFYQLGGNYIIENRLRDEFPQYVPARNVLHIRLHTDMQWYYPLVGVSPIVSAGADMAAADALKAQQFSFYMNQARPSFVLSTDLLLKKDQVDALRARWDDQTKGLNQGGTPILTGGLKPHPIQVSARDAQLAEVLKMTNEDIAMAFRVPLALLGIGSAPHSSTEALMQEWIATGLGFCLNHIEEAFDRVFNLWGQPDEYVEFSTDALLRSAFKDRIAGLKDGVIGGIYSPNEARNMEGLDDVPFGDEPRVQQQVVPLSAASAIPAGPPGKPIIPPSPPAPAAPPQPAPRSLSDAQTVIAKSLLARARRAERRRLTT